jgi:hypothetical protein
MRADEGRVDGPPPPDAARLRTIAALDMTGLPKASDTPDLVRALGDSCRTPDRERRFIARDAATAASEAKSWFLGAASHELRTRRPCRRASALMSGGCARSSAACLTMRSPSAVAARCGCGSPGRRRRGLLRAEVLDHGPGVPAGLRNRLSQDFAHQDPGGAGPRPRPGGLGPARRAAGRRGRACRLAGRAARQPVLAAGPGAARRLISP